MNELIRSIFAWQKYEAVHSNGQLELYKKNDYWLIYYISIDLVLNDEMQSSLLIECKKNVADPALDKNINLLLVFEIEELNAELMNKINIIEEDSYFFRKRVLFYKNNELKKLQEIIKEEGLCKVFDELAIGTETFSNYKKGSDWQNLLYRIIIKISSIKINSAESIKLDSLYNNIQKNISTSTNSKVLLDMDLAVSDLSDLALFDLGDLEKDSKDLLDWLIWRLEEK